MDRNDAMQIVIVIMHASLSARRAWIEIDIPPNLDADNASLSARRAWIEIFIMPIKMLTGCGRSPQGERG